MKIKWWQALLFGAAVAILTSCEKKIIFVDRVRVDTFCVDKVIDTTTKYCFSIVSITKEDFNGKSASGIVEIPYPTEETKLRLMDKHQSQVSKDGFSTSNRKFYIYDTYVQASLKRQKLLK